MRTCSQCEKRYDGRCDAGCAWLWRMVNRAGTTTLGRESHSTRWNEISSSGTYNPFALPVWSVSGKEPIDWRHLAQCKHVKSETLRKRFYREHRRLNANSTEHEDPST